MKDTAIATLIHQLTQRARSQQVVATQVLESGLTLLLYPMTEGCLLGLGCNAEQVHRLSVADLLRQRAAALSRYGAWLPATLQDGSFYLVRRLTDIETETEDASAYVALSEEAMRIAQELLI